MITILLLGYKVGISIVLFLFTVKTAFTCKRNMASHTSTLFGFQNMDYYSEMVMETVTPIYY